MDYLTSGDFNGYPVYQLRNDFGTSPDEAKNIIKRLLEKELIEVMFGNIHPNPHIKAFSNIPNEHQRKFLEDLEFTEHFCLYPTKETLSTNPAINQFNNSPFTFELAQGYGQLDFRVFDLSILEHYRNDPRYNYETDFIHGSISIHDNYFENGTVAEHDEILLQTFGFAYDPDLNRSVAVFLRYLANLTPEHQQIWRAKRLAGDYKLHPDYYRTSILGEWGTRLSVFEAFTQELEIINEMATTIEKTPLFKKSFHDERPKDFGFLLRPTLAEFNSFVLLLDKMMSDNINKAFFGNDIALEVEEERADGKIIVRQKGTITLLKEWITKYYRPADPIPIKEMFETFRKVRELRQKPAHAVNENVFDQKYFKEQRHLIISAYDAIRILRLTLANHPKVQKSLPKIGTLLEKGKIWDI